MTAPDRLSAALADRYRLERQLGQGGMATVFLAHDVKHNRKVAIKVLKPELSAILGGERFLAEIKTTANLQHPHILALHDSGEADGVVFYVMPFVEGESLRDRLVRERQLPVDDAVRIAGEVASALDYAHRHGVVHRDIKPENILLHEGQALVADFGIALAASRSEGGTRMTETGMSLGTPHYMAPEQAMGEKEITPKVDLYALGCVLYEMLAGEPPFTGPSAQAIVARVMTEQPRSLTLQRHTVPAHIDAVVRKALEKLPADRFATAGEFSQALRDATFGPAHTLTSAGTAAAPRVAGAWWRDWRTWAVAAGLAAAGVIAGRQLRSEASPGPVVRFQATLPNEHSVTGAPINTLALSPDGRTVVYVGGTAGVAGYQLFERGMDELGDFRPIAGTEGGQFPAFSPDGTKLAFLVRGEVEYVNVPFTGGAPTRVAPAAAWSQIAWLDQRTVAFNDDSAAVVVATLDGTVRSVTQPNRPAGEHGLWVTGALPGGQVLTIASQGISTFGPIVAIEPGRDRRATLVSSSVSQAWYADGCLLWSQRTGALQAAALDTRQLRLTGPAVTLADPIRQAIGGGGQAAVSAVGSLVYLPDQPPSLVLLDRQGKRTVLASGRHYHSPRFSPDGRRLALDFTQDGARDVYTFDLAQHTLTRVSFENDGHDPVWSPDGRWIYYIHSTGIWRRRADGSGTPDSVSSDGGQALEVERDGTIITSVGLSNGAGGGFDLKVMRGDSGHAFTTLLDSPYNEEDGTLSPDGRWLAYTSDETGRTEVYVRQYPSGAAKVLISRGGGTEPRWSPDGRTLYYEGQNGGIASLIAAPVVAGPEFTVGTRTPLFEVSDYEPAEPHANWDVAPDGSQFAAIYQGQLTNLTFILNWPELVHGQPPAGAPR
jgi:eukaryotic-like serine/threonine-protein kinase